MSDISKLAKDLGPRMVSMAELRKRLGPVMVGVPWAEDALQDLWRMGAPDPNPSSRPCDRKRLGCWMKTRWGMKECEKHACKKEKRLLLPTQFTKWWEQVAERQGLTYTPKQIIDLTRYSHLRDPRKLDGS